MKYEIRCRVWFPCQDGYDYTDHETNGEIYDKLDEARADIKSFRRDSERWGHFWMDYYIKEVDE